MRRPARQCQRVKAASEGSNEHAKRDKHDRRRRVRFPSLPEPRSRCARGTNFVETPAVQDLRNRALAYLRAGFPVHFRGPAGSGKTTLAFHVAAQLGRPVVFLTGDDEMTTSNLVGGQFGYQYRKVVDRFIHTVTKYEEDATRHWSDHRLTTACREGHTLIYDEFTRSRPEANNILLGVLEERLLVLPIPNQNESYIRVHPSFHAIFTSNPQEYSGVHDAQDALSDRMVMIDVDYLDRETEMAITAARSGLHESEGRAHRRSGARLSGVGRIRPGADVAGQHHDRAGGRGSEPAGFVGRSPFRADVPRSARRQSILRQPRQGRTGPAAQDVDEPDRPSLQSRGRAATAKAAHRSRPNS